MDNIKEEKTAAGNRSIDHRRKRINRMKAVIIMIAVIFLLLPTVLCILLGLQVRQLQLQMKDLMELHSDMGVSSEEYEGNYAYAAELPGNITETGARESNLDPVQINLQDEEAAPVSESGPDVDPARETEAVSKDEPDNKEDTLTASQENKETGADTGAVSQGIYSDKKVYLTFDDGPSINTDYILDILAEYKVKATFFVVGRTDTHSLEMYKRIVEEGHTLGMHSYSHKYDKIYNSVEDFDKDFTRLWKLLYDTTGYTPSIYRFPGGSDNLVNKHGMDDFIRYLKEKSFVYFDWNVVSGDATGVDYTKEQLIDNVLGGVIRKNSSIVLMHDSKSKKLTVDSLPGLLQTLTEGGAQILPLDSEVTPIQMIKADSVK